MLTVELVEDMHSRKSPPISQFLWVYSLLMFEDVKSRNMASVIEIIENPIIAHSNARLRS